MSFKSREQLATKYGITLASLNSRIKNSWADFPEPAYKIGVRHYYNEEQAGFYIETKLAAYSKKISDRLKKKDAQPDSGYFGGQKFITIVNSAFKPKVQRNLNSRSERDKNNRLNNKKTNSVIS